MDAKVEALVTQWELLKNELNNEIKNTDVYKKVKSWRTENEERIAEFNNIKNAQQEYEKLLDKIKNIEQSCKDENNQKNKAVLKVLREKRQNFKIREKTTKFNKIQNDFLKFIYKIEAILLGEMGIEGDWKGIITSDYDIFLERIIASLLYFVNSELETIMNDKIKTKLKEISKCEKEINNEFCIKFPDADNLGCIDNKIERLKNEYVKYSKNEYEDYVRKTLCRSMLEIVVKKQFPTLNATDALQQYVNMYFNRDHDKKDLAKVYSAISADIHRPKMPITKMIVTQNDLNGVQYRILKHMWNNGARTDSDNPAGNFLDFK